MKLCIVCWMLVFFSLALSMAAQVSGSGTTNYIPVWTDSATLGDSIIFQATPKLGIPAAVGIGTVTPTAVLTVNGPFEKDGSAPMVLNVTGSGGGLYTGNGGGITLTTGGGGGSSNGGEMVFTTGGGGEGICDLPPCQLPGGNGGSVVFQAGGGAIGMDASGGAGGSITLQPGAGAAGMPRGKSGNVILDVSGAGAVGVGTTSPAATLDVAAGGTTLADAWTTRSSRRFKANIQPLEGALAKVVQLQGVSYERKSDGKHEIGVVAEDVAQIVPEVVSRDPNTHELQGVDYSRLTALLIEAVKSQQAEIQHLKAQVEQLTSNNGGQ
jgi:hypothetical protein